MPMVNAKTYLFAKLENGTEATREMVNKNDGKSHANICMDCEFAVKQCEWSRDFMPVPGWNAELVFLGDSVTYAIKECPKFIQSPPRTSTGGVLSDEEEKKFLKDPEYYLKTHDHMTAEIYRRGNGRLPKNTKHGGKK